MQDRNHSRLVRVIMILMIASVAILSSGAVVSAQGGDGTVVGGNRNAETNGTVVGGNRGSDGGGSGGVGVQLQNPFRGGSDLITLLRVLIQDIIIPLGAVVAALGIIYSGFLFVTAQGNTEKLKTARLALLYSVIGAAILLGSWVIATAIEGTIDAIRSDT